MQISMQLSYAGGFKEAADTVAELEKAGLDLVWVAEAYGFDGPSLMGYLAARTETVQIASGILPIYTRTPTLLAMTAAGMDALSDGRCQLGLGASGPQVIEGWHGVPYDRPLGRTREIIEICRKVWAREDRLRPRRAQLHAAARPTGRAPGSASRSRSSPTRSAPRIPIWVASLGPKNVEMTAEVADGWMPLFYLPEKAKEVWGADLDAGLAKRDAELGPLQITRRRRRGHRRRRRRLPRDCPADDGALRRWHGRQGPELLQRPGQALRLRAGGRGDPGPLPRRQEGRGGGQWCPTTLLEATSLCGPEGYVKERIAAYQRGRRHPPQRDPDPRGDQTPGRRPVQGQGLGELTRSAGLSRPPEVTGRGGQMGLTRSNNSMRLPNGSST